MNIDKPISKRILEENQIRLLMEVIDRKLADYKFECVLDNIGTTVDVVKFSRIQQVLKEIL